MRAPDILYINRIRHIFDELICHLVVICIFILYLPFILADHLLQLETAAEDGLVGGCEEDGLGPLVPLALLHGLHDAPHQVRAQRVGRGSVVGGLGLTLHL